MQTQKTRPRWSRVLFGLSFYLTIYIVTLFNKKSYIFRMTKVLTDFLKTITSELEYGLHDANVATR